MSSDFSLSDKWFKKLDKQLQNLIDKSGFDKKTLDEVFDKSTLLVLGKLISDKTIDYLDFPISTGKEANIFRGVLDKKKFVAIKIYRTSNATFKHITKYIIGDPRFDLSNKNRREVIFEWAKKEFRNLQRLDSIKINVPKPIKLIKNVLVFEYLGSSNSPSPLLKDVNLKNPELIFNRIIKYIDKMYEKAEIVHADLSQYNIIIHKNKPFIIDVGQAVIIKHPMAYDFLKRDIINITNYFKKYNIRAEPEKIYNDIVNK